MKTRCPKCNHENDIDPKALPRTDITSCPKCANIYSVKAPGAPAAGQNVKGSDTATGSKVVPLTFQPRPRPQAPPTHRLTFHGRGLELLRLYLVTNLLTVLTLGVYHFWGKVKIRRYLYSSTELMGERFGFSGTGRELLTGWLKAMGVMIVAFGAPNVLSTFVHPAFGFLLLPLMLTVIPLAMVGAWRYRLSRTNWHGARFSFTGSSKEFLKLHIKGTLLTALTLGLYSPYFHVQKERFWRSNARYGTAAFDYTGKAQDIRKEFLKAVLLFVPTLGLYLFWYKAAVARYDWEHTTLGDLKFKFDATGRELLSFSVGNLLLLAITLGFAYPWVITRAIRFTSAHLSMRGEVDFARVGQTAQQGKAVGEGLAGILDADIAL